MHYNERTIIEGLVYHFNNYYRLHQSLNPIVKDKYTDQARSQNWITINSMRHELTAYLNRMGQFYFYAKSDSVTDLGISYEIEMPEILRFIPLRHKLTAHRAFDNPRKNEEINQIKITDSHFHGGAYMLINGRFIVQLKHKNDVISFDLIKEHSKIISEAKKLLDLIEDKKQI
ncbi:hypothetical protein CW751_08040 [Brumimicrobium salinarum]|uniref:Uncharacterized protein n=1 Tax=Brumimicrobium salinarum TaxID=2058658 RepID=A0A2I0R2A4_9FLAO|nr:hypothetical protein [Brumimicrobium salinarum]PKR80711.1 hypothetical protein CW751_08040 [Brumimicrobium salinarum]